MGKWIAIVFSTSIILACSSNNISSDAPPDLVGTWLLIEQYADPGDGSGDYEPVNSEKTISFLDDNTYIANSTLCSLSTESGGDFNGTYQINEPNLAEFSSENFLIPEDCFTDELKVFIHFERNHLILSFLCIEGCGQKYRKL